MHNINIESKYGLSLKQLVIWVLITFFAIKWQHDIYQALLAVSTSLAVYFIVLNIWKNKASRLVMFILISMCFCQSSVTVKRALMYEGFLRTFKENPFGVLVADIFYGFRHLVFTVIEALGGVHQALANDYYSTLEQLNYRFMTLAIMWIVLSVYILLKPAVPNLKTMSAGGMPQTV